MSKTKEIELSIQKLIGTGFGHIWRTNCKCRYRLLKGARSSKKSYDFLGLEVINKIMTDKRRNVVIVRNTFNSNRDSTWARLVKLINQPDFLNQDITLRPYFKFNRSEMTITYLPTGQVILFKGFDDPYKLASIEVPVGYLTDVYIEEAFEIKYYDDFSKFDQSVRGKLPDGLFHQVTFCFNAWSKDHWLYEKFFKGRLEDDYVELENKNYQERIDENLIIEFGRGLALHISTYRINEFRDAEIYDRAMEELKKASIERYKVIALGMRGIDGDVTYDEFKQNKNVISSAKALSYTYNTYAIGIDVGLSDGQGKLVYDKDRRMKSATTMCLSGLTSDFNKMVAIDEYYYANNNKDKKTTSEICEELVDKIIEWKVFLGNANNSLFNGVIPVYVDCADIAFRDNLRHVCRMRNLNNVIFQGSTKLKIQTRVDFANLLMAFGEIEISEKCKNLIREIRDSRKGENGRPREDYDDHEINAWEYGWASFSSRLKRWSSYKEH